MIDINKITLDSNYAKEQHLIVKKVDDLYLIKYNKQFICPENVDTLGKFKSVITDGTTIYSIAPPKSKSYEQFICQNDINDCIIEEFVEGTMINYFYKDGWKIATRSCIGADCKFGGNKTFREMFFEAVKRQKLDLSILNTKYSYSFVLQHPENRIVIPYSTPNLVLVNVFENGNFLGRGLL